MLTSKLRHPFIGQTLHRIKDNSKRGYWAVHLTNKNLPAIASIIALANHATYDLLPLRNTDYLLLPPMSQLFPCATLDDRKGMIIFFDANRSAWIGCELALGDGRITELLATREAKAGQSNQMSSFYLGYPTRDGPRANSWQQMGHFDNLQACVAAYFDLAGALFFFDEEDKKNIREKMQRANDASKFKSTVLSAPPPPQL